MPKYIGNWIVSVAMIITITFPEIACESLLPNRIHLKSRTIDTAKVPTAEYFQALDDESSSSFDDPISIHLIQFHRALSPSQIRIFEERHQVSILYYIPENAYIMRCRISIAMLLVNLEEVHWIGPLLPSDKYSPDLRPHLEPNDWQFASLCVMVMHVADDGSLLSATLQQTLSDGIEGFRVNSLSKDRIEVCFKASPTTYDLILSELSLRNEIIYLYLVPFRQKLNHYSDKIARYGNRRSDLMPSALSELSGSGQIIGCGDTGLDPDHCFFHDPERPIPFVHYNTNSFSGDSFNPNHRKIVQYVTFTEHSAVLDGHGTHVAGTLVGKPWDYKSDKLRTIDQFSGIAMDAKLAFFDISEKEVLNGLNIPKVLDESYFGWAYAAGARIHSNSWGSPTVLYNVDAFDVDKFAWEHKDFLPIFAAGNNGTLGEKQISSPGNAKNALCVGASVSSAQSFEEVFCESGYSPNYYVCQQARSKNIRLTENDVAYFSSMGPTADGRIKPDVVAPGYYIYSAKNAPDQAESCELEISRLLLAHAGTSMSAPVLASTLALVRQYFAEGFYPTGVKRTGVAFNPSAALLKAVAVAGAVALTGFRDYGNQLDHDYRPLRPTPDFVQGFGRTQLDRVLKFTSQSRFELFIAGYKEQAPYRDPEFNTPGQYHEYKVCILGNSKKYLPRFTLVWTDYPAAPLSAVAIVNDLDLQVQYEKKNPATNTTKLSEPIHPNGLDGPDRVNTVERIELTDATSSNAVIVRVTATSLHQAPQPYTLLITGQVAVVDLNQSCEQVKREFPVDLMDIEFEEDKSSDSSPWYDPIVGNMFLFGALVATIVIVCILSCARCIKPRESQKQVPSVGIGRLAPEDAAVLAARSLSIP